MPELIEHIDAIARQKRRDVLYLEFHPETREEQRRYQYERDANRARAIAWLDQHGFAWQPCGPYANPRIMRSYQGQMYIDLPFDETLPAYQQLREFLELPDGSMRHDGIRFYAMSLELADRNKEHDEPGFWEHAFDDFL